MEKGDGITALHGSTYSNKMTDTAKLRLVILTLSKFPAAGSLHAFSLRISVKYNKSHEQLSCFTHSLH